MKYQPLNDRIDPETPPSSGFEYEGDLGQFETDEAEAPKDTFVIGDDGTVLESPGGANAAATSQGSKPWVKPAAFLLSALFVVLTAWNVNRVIQGPPPPPTLSPLAVKRALYLGVMKIDAFKRVHGVTPDSLEDVGLPLDGSYTYSRVDSARYVVGFRDSGTKLEYDSSIPKESVFGSPKELLTMGEKE